MINAKKYIYSDNIHYISNTGHDERGKYYGGVAGDQGGEYTLRSWYSRPWSVVLRYPDNRVGMLIAELAVSAAQNDNIGYDQYERNTYWNALQKADYDPANIRVKCETDCTASTVANAKAAGYIMHIKKLQDIPIDTYSGNLKSRFVAAGFEALTADKYLVSPNYLMPGDVLLYEGHHASINVTCGKLVDNFRPQQEYQLGDRVLKNGMTGNDVKQLQEELLRLDYDLGKYGADGDFGDATEMAVRAFQAAENLSVDGIVGEQTVLALKRATSALNAISETPKYVEIKGGDCYVRAEPNTNGEKYGVARNGRKLPYAGQVTDNGWIAVSYEDKRAWVSDKYGRLV